MLGDWKRDCTSRTLVDSALAGSQALASFCSAWVSLLDSGKATTITTSQKPTTSHLVQRPTGISATFLSLLIDSPARSAGSRLPCPFTLTQPRPPTGHKGRQATPGNSRRSPVSASLSLHDPACRRNGARSRLTRSRSTPSTICCTRCRGWPPRWCTLIRRLRQAMITTPCWLPIGEKDADAAGLLPCWLRPGGVRSRDGTGPACPAQRPGRDSGGPARSPPAGRL